LGLKFSDNVEMTIDRPHNDSRYLINCEKIKHAGWSQSSVFEQEIEGVFSWYLNKDYTEGQLGAL
jgi:dTDP-D-glucose 4,6-dehydratase